ncbi:3-1 [Durusdinium trenchii]|uniref:3-1 n=1 Tax=Durusdinium trenchii TaxID=1381693 RepID=A0ABP0IIL2_9DINO
MIGPFLDLGRTSLSRLSRFFVLPQERWDLAELLNDCGDETCDSSDLSLRQLRANLTAERLRWRARRASRRKCSNYGNCCADIASCSKSPSPAAPVEEFNAPLDLDSDPIWTWSDGGLYEGAVRFVKEQISFSDGKMKITAKPNPGISTQECSHAEVGKVAHKPLVSGELRARRNMFRYGRYEVRMKAPDVQPGNPDVNGNFVATMFVFRDAKFHHWREIDIEVTGDRKNSVTWDISSDELNDLGSLGMNQSIFLKQSPWISETNTCNRVQVTTNVLSADNTEWWSPRIAASREAYVGGNAREDFHTYGFEWLPNKVTWFIDGKVVRTHYGGHPPIPDKSAKIMMNLWIFGPKANFGGKEIHNNRYPMTSEYDWFRFYKWDDEPGGYPCIGSDSCCLTQDDRYLDGNNPCDGQPMQGTWKGKGACTASCR